MHFKWCAFNFDVLSFQMMVVDEADEVVLETEITNKPALRLYENLGFVRDKRLFRYYLNGVDALRLKLWLRWKQGSLLWEDSVDAALDSLIWPERGDYYQCMSDWLLSSSSSIGWNKIFCCENRIRRFF